MQAVIFDLDGVLVNSMPAHFQAWKMMFAKIARLEITERDVYLLEGMRAMELVEKIFEQKDFSERSLVRSDFKGIIQKERVFERAGLLRKVLCR